MSTRKEEKNEAGIKYIIYKLYLITNIETDKVVRRIPYKIVYKTGLPNQDKITIFDTRLFKYRGNRFWFKSKLNGLDVWNAFDTIKMQGINEGWYDPFKMNCHVESSTKEQVLSKYKEYNSWLEE